MKIPAMFTVYLRNLNARDVEFRVIEDGRHILQITRDVSLYVHPDEDDLAAIAEGLWKLATDASDMAAALEAGSPRPTGIPVIP